MEALILTLFISLVLVFLGVILLAVLVWRGHLEHGDGLSLLPLEKDGASTTEESPSTQRRS